MESCHFNRLDPFTSAARETEHTGRINRDLKIESWPSYCKRQTANCGLRLAFSRYPSTHISELKFAGGNSQLHACFNSFDHFW